MVNFTRQGHCHVLLADEVITVLWFTFESERCVEQKYITCICHNVLCNDAPPTLTPADARK